MHAEIMNRPRLNPSIKYSGQCVTRGGRAERIRNSDMTFFNQDFRSSQRSPPQQSSGPELARCYGFLLASARFGNEYLPVQSVEIVIHNSHFAPALY